jgi:hypothetical protein
MLALATTIAIKNERIDAPFNVTILPRRIIGDSAADRSEYRQAAGAALSAGVTRHGDQSRIRECYENNGPSDRPGPSLQERVKPDSHTPSQQGRPGST